MVIEEVMPSDGGLYSCMAVSPSGNASRDVAVHSKILYLLKSVYFLFRWTLLTVFAYVLPPHPFNLQHNQTCHTM